jgi:hypothetical protein
MSQEVMKMIYYDYIHSMISHDIQVLFWGNPTGITESSKCKKGQLELPQEARI